MSETPEFLREQEEEDGIPKGLKCANCSNDITNAADLESYGVSGLCSHCAHKMNEDYED